MESNHLGARRKALQQFSKTFSGFCKYKAIPLNGTVDIDSERLENEVQILLDGSFYFSEVSQLNDPHEMYYDNSTMSNQNGIFSISYTQYNHYMWCHYCSTFNGICVIFDEKQLKKVFSDNQIEFRAVKYKIFLNTNSLYEKLFYWFFEREFRAVKKFDSPKTGRDRVLHLNIKPTIVQIGYKVDFKIQQQLIDLCIKKSIDYEIVNPDCTRKIPLLSQSRIFLEELKEMFLNGSK